MISTQVKLDNGKLLSLKPANLEVQRKPKLEDRIKESQERALRRAEERRRQDAKREEAAAAREAVHREEARRQKKKHDEELARLAEQKKLQDAEAQEALEAREALRQSSLRKNRAKAKASAATAESTAVMTSVRLKFCGAIDVYSFSRLFVHRLKLRRQPRRLRGLLSRPRPRH